MGSHRSNPLAAIGSWPVPNAAAAVLRPDGVLATFGDTALPFALASVTKPLSALAALVAVEEGVLTLDQPIAELPGTDPGLAAQLPTATLRHLLSHASGLAPEQRSVAVPVGSRRIYSNAGFDLVGEFVAAATDIPFADYLAEAVFSPLRMTSAVLAGSPASAATAAVSDLIAVLGELLAPTGLLHPDTLAAANTVQFPGLRGVLPGYGGQEHNDWGLGFEIRADKNPHWTSATNSPASYGHFGRSGTMFWIDPAAGLGLVALADRDFGPWAMQAWPALSESVLNAFS